LPAPVICSNDWARKPPRAATRVVDGLADARVDDAHHGADDLARREELAAVVALLAHLEQQAFVDLREREDVGRGDHGVIDLVDLVDDVEEVALGVDARALDGAHDLADDLLARVRPRLLAQAPQVRQQLLVEEVEEGAQRARLQFRALGAVRRRPVAPAIRRPQRRPVLGPDRSRFVGLDLFALVEDAQEEDPGELGHVLQRPGAVGAPHDVADRLDGLVDRLLRGELLAVRCHGLHAPGSRLIRKRKVASSL